MISEDELRHFIQAVLDPSHNDHVIGPDLGCQT